MNNANVVKHIVNWLNSYSINSKTNGFVVGISGGIDSAVTLSLAVNALGSEKVAGLVMPFTVTKSVDLAVNHAKSLNVTSKIINISDIVSSYKDSSSLFTEQLSEGNLHSRIRMSLLYGACFSSNYL